MLIDLVSKRLETIEEPVPCFLQHEEIFGMTWVGIEPQPPKLRVDALTTRLGRIVYCCPPKHDILVTPLIHMITIAFACSQIK